MSIPEDGQMAGSDSLANGVQRFLEQYPVPMRELIIATRAFVLETTSAKHEIIDPPSRLIAYGHGPRMSDTICTIMPQNGWINLGIFKGATLSDPARLMTGTGKVHRHAVVRSSSDLSPDLADLLGRAASRGSKSPD